jgi:zinc transport system substrate-binding protein
MIESSGNTDLTIIRVNETTPQIHSVHGTGVNAHTFLSFTNAIQQTYAIQKAIAALRPDDAETLQRNAADYARTLRVIKARASMQLAEPKITRVVTVHDGYGYLLQEFGLEVVGVVQPAHGLIPSATELTDMVELLQKEKIRVVFSEETFPAPLLELLRSEADVNVYIISHVASGAYTADTFEQEMQKNMDTIIEALVNGP